MGEKVDPSRERRWSSQREHAPITAHTQEPPYLTSTNHQPYETNNWKQCFREPAYIHTTTNLTWLNQYIDGLLHEPPTIEDQCGNNVSENRHIFTPRSHRTWREPTTIHETNVAIMFQRTCTYTQPPTTVLDLIESIVGSLNHQPYETSVHMMFQRSNILNTYTNSSSSTILDLDHRAHVTMEKV